MKNIILKIFCCVFALCIASCSLISQSNQLHDPVRVQTVTPIPLIAPAEAELEGIIYFNCSNKIVRYDLSSDELKTIFYDNPHHIQDLSLAGNDLYFSKTVFIPNIAGFGPNELFKIDVNGNNFEQLTFDEYYDVGIKVLPNLGKIIYHSDREGTPEDGRYNLVQLNLNNLNQQILFHDDNFFIPTRLAPDGEKIIYWESENLTQDFFLHDLVTGNQSVINISQPGFEVQNLVWSPDSKQLAGIIQEKETEVQKIIIIDDQSGVVIAEYPIERSGKSLLWNHDGSQILFFSYDQKGTGAHYLKILNLALNEIIVSVEVENFIGDISWNTDGTQILFETRNGQFINNTYHYKLWAFNLENKNLTLLDEDIQNQLGNWGYSAHWSPDGNALIYSNYPESGNECVEYFRSSRDYEEIKRINLPCYHVVDLVWTLND